MSIIFYKKLFCFLSRHGIDVIGFSSDGDSRLLSTMMANTKLNATEGAESNPSSPMDNICFLQDSVHNGTKGRNRFLKPSVVLPMGNKLISVSHLKILINKVPKYEHGLTYKDICPDDRQNYASLEKVMEPRVSFALSAYVPGSEGTIAFINLLREITSSLYDDAMNTIDRIYHLFHAIYLMRAWRNWIKDHDSFTISENFVSHNLYSCIELNGANLIKLIKKFRAENMDEYFMPSLFNSQPNEELFRQLRSMGTTNYTKINFTLLELFHLVGRIDLQNEIVYIRLNKAGVHFPRNKMNKAELNKERLPSDEEIRYTMDKAKATAIDDAKQIGMNVGIDELNTCQIKPTDISTKPVNSKKPAENIDVQFHEQSSQLQELGKSRYVEVSLENGRTKKVRKSTFLWSITDPAKHLSNDRLKRVQLSENENARSCRRRLVFKSTVEATNPIMSLNTNLEIQIGDWCVFHLNRTENENKTEEVFILGNVLSFRYIDGNSAKAREYSWDFAPVIPDANTKKRGVEVLASWYEIRANIRFMPINRDGTNNFYTNIENYVSTFVCSGMNIDKQTDSLSISSEMTVVQNLLEQLKFTVDKSS